MRNNQAGERGALIAPGYGMEVSIDVVSQIRPFVNTFRLKLPFLFPFFFQNLLTIQKNCAILHSFHNNRIKSGVLPMAAEMAQAEPFNLIRIMPA